jgi:hypothetical protein
LNSEVVERLEVGFWVEGTWWHLWPVAMEAIALAWVGVIEEWLTHMRRVCG